MKVEPPSPAPPVKGSDLATALKNAEVRLAESEKRIKQATESLVASVSSTRNIKTHPTEPRTDPAVAVENTETRADPAVAAKNMEAHPAKAETQPLAEPDADLAIMLEDMEARLIETEKRATEYHDAWLRAKAETENMLRRAQEDIAKASKFAAEKFAGAILPVKDSLEAALVTEGQTLEKLREGVELTLKQLAAAFDAASLTEEKPLGQKFDPNKHQAIGVIESEAEPNTVINVLQKGYLLHGRVIRPAMVMVSKAKT